MVREAVIITLIVYNNVELGTQRHTRTLLSAAPQALTQSQTPCLGAGNPRTRACPLPSLDWRWVKLSLRSVWPRLHSMHGWVSGVHEPFPDTYPKSHLLYKLKIIFSGGSILSLYQASVTPKGVGTPS